jgi:hypothetical protein
MLSARRRNSIRPPLVPPLVFMGTAVLISLAAAQLVSAAPLTRTTAQDCAAPGAAARAAAHSSRASTNVAQRLDARGQFVGRGLTISAAGRQTAVSLPPDSSISQPVGDALLYTTATGGASEIHLVDAASGCDAVIVRPSGVVRSAILDATQSAVYAHSVTFPARADAGVARYALDGSSTRQVVGPLPDDARFGATFGTQLGWSSDGRKLFVQSCGAVACRTRLLDVASGAVSMFDGPDQGQIIGVTAQHVIAFAACSGLPCAVQSIDIVSGAVTQLANEAWSADLDGSSLTISTAAGNLEVAQ